MQVLNPLSRPYIFTTPKQAYNQLSIEQKSRLKDIYKKALKDEKDSGTRNAVSYSPVSVQDPILLDGVPPLQSLNTYMLDSNSDSKCYKDQHVEGFIETCENTTLSRKDNNQSVLTDYKSLSEVGCGNDFIQSKEDSGVRFANKLSEREIPGRRQLYKEERTHLLWKHPSEYQEAREADEAEFHEHVEKLRNEGRDVPNGSGSRKILNNLYQPELTKPYIPLIEID